MAISASEIVDAESFKEWLKGKPKEVGQVIATRCVLRFMPTVFRLCNWGEYFPHDQIKAQYTLVCFHCNFMSLTVCRYPSVNITLSSDVALAVGSISNHIGAARMAAFTYATLKHTDAAVSAVVDVAKAASVEAEILGIAPKAAWEVMQQDCIWLEQNSFRSQELINFPLFIHLSESSTEYIELESRIEDLWRNFNTFALNNSPEELHRPLSFIAAWYGVMLPKQFSSPSLLGKELDIELATQFEEFWEGNPIEVLNRVADLVGWGEPKIAAKMEAIQEDVDANSISLEGISADGALSWEVDGSNDQDSQSRKQLLYQIDYLMATASLHEVTANSIASQIENEVTNYLNVVRINELPEELQVIGRIGGVIRSIGEKVVLASTDPSALKVLKEKIQSLEKELEIAQTELAKPEYRDSFDRYFDIAMESGAKYAGPVILASAAGFVARFADPGMLHELGIAVQNYLRSRP